MPKRHGLNLELELPTIQFGISEICTAVGHFPFNPKISIIPDSLGLFAEHFNKTVERRIFYALHSLQTHINNHAENWNGTFADIVDKTKRDNREYYSYQAAASVESFFFYWGMLIDDLARVIIYAMDREPDLQQVFKREIDIDDIRFASLKTRILKHGQFPQIKHLFEGLEDTMSWWMLGFEHAKGFRHRFMHYTDSFSLNGGNSPHVWQFNEEGIQIDADFDYLVLGSFTQFCDWLDRVEDGLRQHLRSRAKTEEILWHEKEECISFKLYLNVKNIEKELRLFPRVTST